MNLEAVLLILLEAWSDEFEIAYRPVIAPFRAEIEVYPKGANTSCEEGSSKSVSVMAYNSEHELRAMAHHLEEEDEIIVDLHDPSSLETLKQFIRKSLGPW